MNAISESSFHSYIDTNVRAYQTYKAGEGWSWINQWPELSWVELSRTLGYRFFPHFHPYVLELVKRLNAGGVAGLQAADTDDRTDAAGSGLTIPNSTRGTLLTPVSVTKISDGGTAALLAGAPLSLDDGSVVAIAAATPVLTPDGSPSTISTAAQVTLPGVIPAALPSGTLMAPGGGSPFVLPDGTTVTLPAVSTGTLSDGTRVTIPAGTAVALRSGIPLPRLYDTIFSPASYNPSALVEAPYPVKDIDFSLAGAYSIYNWELFFHVPLLIAVHLSKNQQYQDAQRWFHYIFDPTDDSAGPTPQRFWKVEPFRTTDVALIERILTNLSSGVDPQLQQDTLQSIGAWKDNPFQPFVVGRYRPTAYMFKTVMAYLDNLIAWGDSLFAQYTIETINEATQLYVMAADILGPRPQPVPSKGTVAPQTYARLRAGLDPFSNALKDVEVDLPFDLAPHPAPVQNDAGGSSVASIGQALYFCIPRNDKLLAYWDTVADRLFKIHNSLNLQGVFQALPLFDPPIDPALLVRAAAAGLDVSAVVSGLNQPLPLVRFQLLSSKAADIAQEVKSLGAGVLAAMEKGDGEALTMLRAKHESALLGLGEMVKYSQWQEAIKAREGIQQSLANTVQRYTYYRKQVGDQDSQISIPTLDDLDINGLESLGFTSTEGQMPSSPTVVDISQDSASVSDGQTRSISRHETQELGRLEAAHDLQLVAETLDGIAGGLSMIPQFGVKASPMGVGATMGFGGIQISKMIQCLSAVARTGADQFSYEAGRTAKLGGYQRRELEWVQQANAAAGEISLIFKQLRAAQIREAVAEKEYRNHQAQMSQAQATEDFLQDKPTNQGFYLWMKGQVKALYNDCFQLAFEVAGKAQRALQSELGDPTQTYLQFSYLDGVEGLMAGEKLSVDLKRMEMAFLDQNRREYELTKHVSVLQVDPLALLELRATGSCTVALPEELFDLDGPGHYFRRIRSVAVSIPCVTGPYASVNCTLTLLNSSIRTTSELSNGAYVRAGSDDQRFSDFYGSVQSVVTSSGQADSGLFETNLRDERYLPFELSGAVSQWRLDLPAQVRQFDYDTIADVILHVRYTAREGGNLLCNGAAKNLQARVDAAQTVGSVRLLSVRHEFPGEWARLRSATIGGATPTAGITLALLPQHYPYWSQAMASIAVKAVEVIAEMVPGHTPAGINVYNTADKSGPGTDALSADPSLGHLLAGTLSHIPLPAPVTDATHPPLTLYFDDNAMADLWVAVTWGKA